MHIVEFFNSPDSNPNNAQSIFATYDTNILGEAQVSLDIEPTAAIIIPGGLLAGTGNESVSKTEDFRSFYEPVGSGKRIVLLPKIM